MLMHRKHFTKKSEKYLESKGLSIKIWADSIMDGRKGDVMVLFGLNLLLEVHTIVHLKGGKTWSHWPHEEKTMQQIWNIVLYILPILAEDSMWNLLKGTYPYK